MNDAQRIARDASQNAITDSFNKGLSITVLFGNSIVQVFPNHRTNFIKTYVEGRRKLDKDAKNVYTLKS